MTRRHLIIMAVAAAIGAVCLLGVLKPALIRTERGTRLMALFRWQSGQIRFINSVTGLPVAIHFRIGRRFQAFSYTTDETTAAYYTGGLYDLNPAVSQESTDRLSFCSVKGMSLAIGLQTMEIQDGCLDITLLWTIW